MRKEGAIRRVTRLMLAVSILVLTVNHLSAIEKSYKKQVVIVNLHESFSKQFNKGPATYIIKGSIDLRGERISMPVGSTLYVKKGVIRNGKIEGDYVIQADSRKIFENVDISSYKYPFKFSWLIGRRRELYSKDFNRLPNVEVDFEGEDYIAKESIILDGLPGFHFVNFNLKTGFALRYWNISETKGECQASGNGKGYLSCIHTSNSVPDDFLGYVIEISTADETKFDSRPDANGVPTLYKGLTSIITGISGDKICVSDSLERFSGERIYNKHRVKASYVIYKPRKFVLENCKFVFTRKTGASLNGYDFLIDKCTFEATNGSNALLSLGGYAGKVSDCVFRGAFYTGTGTSYGIQVNKGTKMTIENSEFYENRRGVDFSGTYESRYNEVRSCFFYQEKNEGKTGSAIGGHSTSFGNVFRNNKIYGDYQIGIHCRGENEVIVGNTFECFAIWMIGYGYNTMIIDNKVVPSTDFATGVFAGSDINVKGNRLTMVNNDIDVRAILIVGNKSVKYYLENNKMRFRPNTASLKPVVFSEAPTSYEINNNTIECSRSDVKVKLTDGVELPQKTHVKVR